MDPVNMGSLVDLMETNRLDFSYWLSGQMAYPETQHVIEWQGRSCCCILKALVDLTRNDKRAAEDLWWLFVVLGILLPHATKLRCAYREHVNELLVHAADSFQLMHLMLPHRSNVDFRGSDGDTVAWHTESPLVLDLLVQHGADLNLYRGPNNQGMCGYYLEHLEGDVDRDYYFKSLCRHVRSGVLHLYPCASLSSRAADLPQSRAHRLVRAHTHYCLDLLASLEKAYPLPRDMSLLVMGYGVPII